MRNTLVRTMRLKVSEGNISTLLSAQLGDLALEPRAKYLPEDHQFERQETAPKDTLRSRSPAGVEKAYRGHNVGQRHVHFRDSRHPHKNPTRRECLLLNGFPVAFGGY